MWLRLVLPLGLVGCVEDRLVECGDLACPIGSICTSSGCAVQEQLDACTSLIDNDTCTTSTFPGICISGACLPVVCGDGKIIGREVCDDRNQLAGDGCSADCISTEICGNDYIDVVLHEQCDEGVRGLARDGCTSTCTLELDSWVDLSPTLPQPNVTPGIAYDSRRRRVVMFGGTGIGANDETWEWDGTTWRHMRPATSPPGRASPAMTYDADRGRVVLFGGNDGVSGRDDTWEWDGITWTERMPPVTPGPRISPQMVHDPVRRELVMFGGGASSSTWVWDGSTWAMRSTALAPNNVDFAMAWDAQSDRVILFSGASALTWAWNGTAWSTIATATDPPARMGTAMAATSNGRILMYGGINRADAWEWVAGNWVARNVATNPSDRGFHAMVLDADRAQLVLFGGVSGGAYSNDLYEWNGTTWIQRVVQVAPAPRVWAAAAYQPLLGRTIMFGGFLNDQTWEWDGLAWTPRTLALRPPARAQAAMVATRDRILMFGGSVGPSTLDDTWEWNGLAWSQRSPAQRPSRRGSAAMVYDTQRDRVVLFGGAFDDQSVTSDTWEWDGVTWTQRSVVQAPPGRWGAAMAYDPVRARTVLFGGDDGSFSGRLADTWEWDGNAWTAMSPAESPPARMFADAAYDPARRTVTMFGGQSITQYADTWEWNGSTWSELDAVVAPPARHRHVAVYDHVRGELVAFGGDTSAMVFGDTQAHRFASRAFPADACLDVDTDGDTLVGCADPDCWGRCAPLCPPGAPCDPAAPKCGDGACSVLEDYRLCPADCAP